MEPILAKADNYSFLKKLVENVKQTKDAQAPDDDEINKVTQENIGLYHLTIYYLSQQLSVCSKISHTFTFTPTLTG